LQGSSFRQGHTDNDPVYIEFGFPINKERKIERKKEEDETMNNTSN